MPNRPRASIEACIAVLFGVTFGCDGQAVLNDALSEGCDSNLGVVGCEGCTKFAGCPAVDQNAGPGDYAAQLYPGVLASFKAGGDSSMHLLRGGELVFAPEVPYCVATPDAPCGVVLKRMNFEFGDFTMELTNGSVLNVERAIAALTAPLELENAGSGYVVPAGRVFQSCALVNGREQHGSAISDDVSFLEIEDYDEFLAVDASFQILVHADNQACSDLSIRVSLTAHAMRPWQSAPD